MQVGSPLEGYVPSKGRVLFTDLIINALNIL